MPIAALGAAKRSVGHVSLLWNRHGGSVDAGEKRLCILGPGEKMLNFSENR